MAASDSSVVPRSVNTGENNHGEHRLLTQLIPSRTRHKPCFIQSCLMAVAELRLEILRTTGASAATTLDWGGDMSARLFLPSSNEFQHNQSDTLQFAGANSTNGTSREGARAN